MCCLQMNVLLIQGLIFNPLQRRFSSELQNPLLDVFTDLILEPSIEFHNHLPKNKCVGGGGDHSKGRIKLFFSLKPSVCVLKESCILAKL